MDKANTALESVNIIWAAKQAAENEQYNRAAVIGPIGSSQVIAGYTAARLFLQPAQPNPLLLLCEEDV